jgi:hypothetical protein
MFSGSPGRGVYGILLRPLPFPDSVAVINQSFAKAYFPGKYPI